MREIKFRGLAGNVWRYGDYETYYFKEKVSQICTKDKEHYTVGDTVGQYTGLKDKNGKEIYEGDILQWEEYGKTHSGYWVVFDYTGFKLWNGRYHRTIIDPKWYEVIGNIHENPELLEVQHGDN